MLLLPFWLLLFYFKERIAEFLISNVFNLDAGSRFTQTLSFFISTLLKIYLLLTFFIFIMALIRTYIPVHTVKRKLAGMHLLPAHITAGLSGVITPFCSCSAVPVFIGFLEAGIPLGMTFTFLIASPLANEVIIIMLGSLFGIRIALIYALAGLFIAIVSGLLIHRFRLEKYLPLWLLTFRNVNRPLVEFKHMNTRFSEAFGSVREVLSKTWIYILAGVILGSVIHGYVPEGLLSKITSGNKWYSIPMAVLSGMPLYACSASVAPVAFALADKGLSAGTALAFVMAVAGLSLPEFVMLKKVLNIRLLLIFAGIVFTGIVLVGFLFNWIL